jgi:hypothetical protein
VFGKRSNTDMKPAPAAPAVAPKPPAAPPAPQGGGGGDRLAPLSSAGLGAPLVSAPTPTRVSAPAPPPMATDSRIS